VEEHLKDATVVAPFDGVIVVKNVDQGDIVQSGQVLMKFANIKKLQVEFIMAVSGMTGINEPESISKISTSA
jgi:multidrug efflux pump subunit AcrA (membrane-fusion protein)